MMLFKLNIFGEYQYFQIIQSPRLKGMQDNNLFSKLQLLIFDVLSRLK